MAFSVSDFRSNLQFDGARPNLFEVNLTFPFETAGVAQKSTFLIKASQLPGSTIGTVPVYYFGRELKFAGNRTFPDWSVTVINDEDFLIRNAMENWMNYINSNQGNVRDPAALSPTGQVSSYTADATVLQYSKLGETNILAAYNFVDLFPIDVSPIELDWGSNDQMEEFQVTFAYQYWQRVDQPNITT